MAPNVPPGIPRRGGPLTRAIGRAALRLLGWRVEGRIPDLPKLVVIAAPHRSNWDFVVGLAAKFALGIDAHWLGKHTLFRAPFGALFRFWGGIPVDRRSSQDTVAAVVQRFASSDRLVLALAPEGTRTLGAPWKTGFWHIARNAGVPILPIAFDRPRRIIHFLPPLEARDLSSDMRELEARYNAVVPAAIAAR